MGTSPGPLLRWSWYWSSWLLQRQAAVGRGWYGDLVGHLFNFFLTSPYLSLVITDRGDLEVSVLLGLVGLAVTETALWGRRQQDRASLNEGLLEGVAAAMAVTASDDPGRVHDVADRLLLVLGVDAVGYDPGPIEEDLPVLGLDGRVRLGSTVLDVSRRGLPNAAAPAGTRGGGGDESRTLSRRVHEKRTTAHPDPAARRGRAGV